ncbi:MAG: aminopeptidase N [Arenicella sp.]|nr:aminopeptidase N [Arenicella sp.]
MLETDLAPSINPTTVYLKDYQAPKFLVPTISLDAELGKELTTITATLRLERHGGGNEPLVLDGEKVTLKSLKIDGILLDESQYTLSKEALTVVDVPDCFSLEIQTSLQPHLNTELSGLFQSSGNFCTQCEAEGFRRITYFPDRPDVLSVYDVTITADKTTCPVLMSNGNPGAKGDNSDGTHWAKWHDPHPKPSYLFALVAGDLKHISDQYQTTSGKRVELNIYTQAHNIEKCQHAMDSLKNSMQWDENVYGLEYDLDVYNIVAVDDFNMGAMENKGLNVFNSKYVLANQQSATDSDYEGIESVIGHEYFHNWSGNRVTCRDWFQLSLKEGFTVFRDQEFSADMGSRSVKRIRDVQILRAYQFKEDAGPMAHPIRPDSYQEINNFYTSTIYQKGAEVIRMMHHLVGAQGFRKGTDLYFDRFDGQAVTTEDFVTSIEQANNIDLQQFRRWYTQSGTPEVHLTQRFEGETLYLDFSQSCPATPNQKDKQPFVIPLALALFSSSGNKLQETMLVLDQVSQSFEFANLDSKPLVSLLRDFSAPIKLHTEQSDQELSGLIEFDDNGFSRWEAMQRLSLNVILPALETGEISESAYQILLQAMQGLISSNPEDKAVYAEMLTLPSAAYITEQCKPINPQRISSVRDECVSRLARDLESKFHALYANNNQRSGFSLDAEAVAERALKNRALSYLVATEQAAYHALASHQYHIASNMTDRLAAFSALIMSSYPERTVLINDFYRHWQHDTLVLDKWFALQAMTPKEETLNNVKDLLGHSAFSMNNPNKVRSLIGAYTGSLVGFHRQDGRGYEFLADIVIELNAINPQVASRLVSVFNNWKNYSEPYKSAMKSQIQRISQIENLAKDVTEIVSKALDS